MMEYGANREYSAGITAHAPMPLAHYLHTILILILQ